MSKKRLLAAATVLTLTVSAWGVQAWGAPGRDIQAEDEFPPVRLKHSTVYVAKDQREMALATVGEGGRDLYIVQFTGPVQDGFKEALVQAGAEIGDYLPEHSFLVRMGEQTKATVEGLGFVRGIARYTPAFKLDPALATGDTEQVPVRVTSFLPSTKEVLSAISALGITPEAVDADGATLLASTPQLQQLAASDDVVYVESIRENVPFNDKAAGIIQVPTLWGAGLDGKGQVVAVTDTGLDNGRNDASLHPDFQGQVKALYAWGRSNDSSDSHGHGTHVAGSILGTGAASNGQVKGMAPGAKLIFQSVLDNQGGLSGIPSDLGQLFQQAYQAGARIHSNSWGVPATAGGAGVYDGQSAAADKFIWENRDYAILFAAGNDGDHDRDGKTNYNTVSTPSTAKNVITVGASENLRPDKGQLGDNADQVASFSSRGLTNDGRVKPDIVAPGSWILSTKSSQAPNQNFWAAHNDKYAFMGGTSMATPITAGTVAQLRQYYVEKLGVAPKAALLKASLINGAVAMSAGGSVQDQGWGRVDLNNTLYAGDGKGFKFDNEEHPLKTGESRTYQYNVAGGAPLKVTLVWTDYPAATTANKTLVNDLDLTVTGPDGQAIMGNHALGAGPDRTNNVENVVVAKPQAGTYTVTVKAHNVPQGPQPYAMVVSGQVNGGTSNPKPQPPAGDTQAPSVSLTAPQAGATLSGTATVSAKAEDNSGVSKVDFFANGVWIGAANNAPYALAWDTATVADGTYSLVANAYDAAGNVGKSAPVTVTVANGRQGSTDLTEVFTGTTGASGSTKRYYVDLPANGTLSLDLAFLKGWARLGVQILDPSGKVVGQGSTDAEQGRVDLASLPQGTYTIAVQHTGGSGDYVLTVRHAAPSTTVTATHSGSLDAAGARLTPYAVQLQNAGALNMAVQATDGQADFDLYLADARGQVLAQATSSTLKPETLSAKLGAGTYMLYVVAKTGAGNFRLTVTHPSDGID